MGGAFINGVNIERSACSGIILVRFIGVYLCDYIGY